jgi:hypothetical protein
MSEVGLQIALMRVPRVARHLAPTGAGAALLGGALVHAVLERGRVRVGDVLCLAGSRVVDAAEAEELPSAGSYVLDALDAGTVAVGGRGFQSARGTGRTSGRRRRCGQSCCSKR